MADYQDQIYVIKRQTQTLSLEAFFATPTLEGGVPDNPLEAKGYSRARLTIIDKTKKPNGVVFANVPESDIAYIQAATNIALSHCLAPKTVQGSQSEERAEEELKFVIGTNKGKTPLQLYCEPDGKRKVEGERAFLERNIEKYDLNARIIKEIDNILKSPPSTVPKQDNTAATVTSSSSIIEVYNQEHKFLASQKDAQGRCLVYSILLKCDLSRKYPFSVTIKNSYAPVKTTATGSANVVMSEAVGTINFSVNLTQIEFVTLVAKMTEVKDNYFALHFAERYAAKERIGAEKRKAAKARLA
jgi:hypothetical protein